MKNVCVSFHNGNLEPEILIKQQEVFDYIGIPLIQSCSHLVHGEHMNFWLKNNDYDVAAVFDIDAICTDFSFLENAMKEVSTASLVIGGAHNANHNTETRDYASPACCVFSRKTFEASLGFDIQSGGNWTTPDTTGMMLDTGQAFSEGIRHRGGTIRTLPVQSVQVPHWRLDDGTMFGNGTDYGPFYHAFESRFSGVGVSLFVERCNRFLTKSY